MTNFTIAKEEIFRSRFLESSPDNSCYCPSIDDAGVLTIFRIVLGEKSLSLSEMAKTNSAMTKVRYYWDKFPGFPVVIDHLGNVFLGGNQSWYQLNGHYTKFIGGCGPAAGANTIASVMWQHPSFSAKANATLWSSHKIATQGEYLKLMEAVYEIIPPLEISFFGIKKKFDRSKGIGKIIPPTLGYFLSNRYRRRIIDYIEKYGLVLKSKNLWGIPKIAEELKPFLALPISFLNTIQPISFYHPDGSFAQKSRLHWVSVLKAEEDRLYISSWGQEFFIRPSEITGTFFGKILNKLNRLSVFYI